MATKLPIEGNFYCEPGIPNIALATLLAGKTNVAFYDKIFGLILGGRKAEPIDNTELLYYSESTRMSHEGTACPICFSFTIKPM